MAIQVSFFANGVGIGDLHMIQDKNPNAVIAEDSLHAASTTEPF